MASTLFAAALAALASGALAFRAPHTHGVQPLRSPPATPASRLYGQPRAYLIGSDVYNASLADNLRKEHFLHVLTLPEETVDVSDYCIPSFPADKAEIGSLLVATRNVRHPDYSHTCCLLFERSDVFGSRALMLNRPTTVSVRDVLKDMPLITKAFGDVKLYRGGLQEHERISVLHRIEGLPNSVQVAQGVYLGDLTTLGVMAAANITSGPLHVFMGRVVWPQDYLAKSLRSEHWSVLDVHPNMLFGLPLPGAHMGVEAQYMWEYMQSMQGGAARSRWLRDVSARPDLGRLLPHVVERLERSAARAEREERKRQRPRHLQSFTKWYGARIDQLIVAQQDEAANKS